MSVRPESLAGHPAAATVEAEAARGGAGAAPVREPFEFSVRAQFVLAGLCGLFLAAGYAVGGLHGHDAPGGGIQLGELLFLAALLVGAVVPASNVLPDLRERHIDVDFLMLLAAFGAAALREIGEGAILMFLFSGSSALEAYTSGRTRQSIEALKSRLETVAERIVEGGTERVPLEALAVGERVLIRPGARVPTDGVVLTGESTVDQSALTGESIPVAKAAGDEVMAGSMNLNEGALTVEVARPAADSTLARMIRLVEEAQESRAETQVFTDWFGERYTWVVIGGTLLTFLIPWLLLGWEWQRAIYKAMTLLVVASPCALVLATPAAILAAISTAARNGILVKGGASLEAVARAKVVVFDKTGTLTHGTPRLQRVCAEAALDENELLRLAASAELPSEHPLAAAVVDEARTRGLTLTEPSSFQARTGRGIVAEIDGRRVLVGNARLFNEEHAGAELRACEACECCGASVGARLQVGVPEFVGCLELADTLRDAAPKMVADLHDAGIEAVAMLTGDTAPVAEAIGRATGIDRVHAELLPEDKLTRLHELREQIGPVIMVGDGVNDAPALAAADVGVAMGGIGSDVALETADVVLTNDRLDRLPILYRLSRRAYWIVRQNLAFAVAVICGLVLTVLFTDAIRMPLAVIAHEGSTVLVILNGLRLLRA